MTARRAAAVLGALASVLALLGPGEARANGETQREVQGRVASVDTAAGTLVVVREFRGQTSHVPLRARAAVRVFVCGEASLTLDRVKPGMTVSVFYEVVGTDGVVNTIVVEPPR